MTKKKNLIFETIIAIIMVVGLVFDFYYSFINGGSAASNIMRGILSLIGYLVIIYYITFGYKIPHGNLLKYIMIFFAVTIALNTVVVFFRASYTRYTIYGLIQLFVSFGIIYMSGRLNKVRQNIYIAAFITVGLIAGTIICFTSPEANTFVNLYNLIFITQWIVIELAYLARYKAHKEAGLEDIK